MAISLKKRFSALILCLGLLLGHVAATAPTAAQTTPIRALVLYDTGADQFGKLGQAYGIMLKNLLGHFNSTVTMQDVATYTAGSIANYDALFYLGSRYDNPVPAAFLTDIQANAATKTVVWFKYNLWQYAWSASYPFEATYGFNLSSLAGLNAPPTPTAPEPGFYNAVTYKGEEMLKYYAYVPQTGAINSDPDAGITTITNPLAAQSMATLTNKVTGQSAPYIVKSGKFWYVADIPFSFIGPRDRYLVMADILHDIVGVDHAQSHKALVRLEDVGALVSVSAMQTLSNFLQSRSIPFSTAVIPHYMDPLGRFNGGVAQSIPFNQATGLRQALDYARARGGKIVMHGYTHQYGSLINPNSGVSGDDFEFWNIVTNTPIAEEGTTTTWARNRMRTGRNQLGANYAPFAWEAPHYQSSPLSMQAVPLIFGANPKVYGRIVYYTATIPNLNSTAPGKDFAVGQFFPYVIGKDHYNQKVLPENLGNIEYDICAIDPSSCFNYTVQDILTNARYAKIVRDGYGSFFFHPFWLEPELGTPGLADFQAVVDGITALGYTWADASTIQ